jgi:acyl-CoA synthetase (AMP-forming)/AMP-acid ligase II
MSDLRIGYQAGCTPLNNVISFLERVAEAAPERVALHWLPEEQKAAWLADQSTPLVHDTMSYGELACAVRAAASGLARLGIGKGDRVFLFVPMSPALYIAMFAVQRLGAVAVFVESWARPESLGHCARLVEAKAMIAPEKAYQFVSAAPGLELPPLRIVVGAHAAAYDGDLLSMARNGGTVPICPVEREDTALITFTTGSSGVPKGADRSHRFLAAQHEAISRDLTYLPGELDLPSFPVFSLNNLAGGVTTVVPALSLARASATDGAFLAAQIRALGIGCCTLSPWLLRGLSAAAIPVPSLRRVATGGAPISSDDVAAFHRVAPTAQLLILYGSTEVEPIAHLDAAEMPAEQGAEGVCVGELCQGLRAKLIRIHKGPVSFDGDWQDWEVPSGDVGELVLSGEHVCRRYYRNQEAFNATKIVEPDGTLWHRSGDLCRRDADGRYWIVGRVHSAICRDGQWLYPVKPEVLMKRLPFVERAAYLGLPDAELGERAVAAAVFSGNAPDDAREQMLAMFSKAGVVVDEFRQVEDIPLDPRHNSKVEYERLRELLNG